MQTRLATLAAALLAATACGPAVPTPSAPEPAEASEVRSPAVDDAVAMFGPWRAAPIALSDELTATLTTACLDEARAQLNVVDEIPVAVVDVRGEGLATVILADEHVAVVCDGSIDPTTAALSLEQPVSYLAPDALGPIEDDQIEIVAYARDDASGAPRKQLIGRVGGQAVEVIATLDDESEVNAAKSNGWFSAWWPGVGDAANIAAVDRQNISISGAAVPDAEVEGRASPASWWVDPAGPPPGPDSTSISALIMEKVCASGMSPEGRVLSPQIFSADDAILITIWVRRRPGGQDCQGNPVFPVAITLNEPIGDRHLLDGSEIPPRDASVPPE
jgi:hypothetical protein